MLYLSFNALVLQFGIAVLALRDDAFDIAVFLLGDQLKAVDADLVLLAGVVLEHRQQDTHVPDLHVFVALERKEEIAHHCFYS
jgi:hypothetical protein